MYVCTKGTTYIQYSTQDATKHVNEQELVHAGYNN